MHTSGLHYLKSNACEIGLARIHYFSFFYEKNISKRISSLRTFSVGMLNIFREKVSVKHTWSHN